MKVIRDSAPVDPVEQAASGPRIEANAFDVAGQFPHEKLDAYRVALEMARGAKTLAQHIPRGHQSVADHLLRSSSNAVLLLAEGANRERTRGEAPAVCRKPRSIR